MKRMTGWLKRVLGPLALVFLTALVGCGAIPRELSFETIERQAAGGRGELWEAEEPGLMVIATAEELNQIDNLVTQEAQEKLRQVDYDAYFVVAAFLGKRTSNPGFQVERVVRRGSQITLYALDQGDGFLAAITSPYQLIEVRKEGKWGRQFTFKLRFTEGEQRIVSVSHHIP